MAQAANALKYDTTALDESDLFTIGPGPHRGQFDVEIHHWARAWLEARSIRPVTGKWTLRPLQERVVNFIAPPAGTTFMIGDPTMTLFVELGAEQAGLAATIAAADAVRHYCGTSAALAYQSFYYLALCDDAEDIRDGKKIFLLLGMPNSAQPDQEHAGKTDLRSTIA